MKQQYWFGAGVMALAFLAGCGGGGDGTTAAAGATGASGGGGSAVPTIIDQYVGTWIGCFADGTASHRESVTLTKTGDASASFSSTSSDYPIAACAGTASATKTETGTVALSGTKTIGADTVDKGVIANSAKPSEKQVFLLKGTGPVTLTTGRSAGDGGTLDADGYPTTLDNNPLTKQ